MNEIKIGDIVQPKTTYSRSRYGQGIVIAIKEITTTRYTIVFPASNESIIIRDFGYAGLLKVMVKPRLLNKIERAGATYMKMEDELKIA